MQLERVGDEAVGQHPQRAVQRQRPDQPVDPRDEQQHAQPGRRDQEFDEESDELTSEDLARIALQGGSFDWLKDEPDLYSSEDGELLCITTLGGGARSGA